TPFDIRAVNRNLPVKTTRTQKSRIQYIWTVCSCDNDNAFVGPKAVHFHKQLVQCLLPFVMTTAETGTTLAADSVNFINKDNTWLVFLRIFKQVTHTGSPDTDKHLNKVRSADREKWRTGLTGNRAGKKCLTRSRGSDKQHAFRNAGTQ